VDSLTGVTQGENTRVNDVLREYPPVGPVLGIFRNTVGLVNKTFLIQTDRDKLILRESAEETDLDHLNLEVEVLQYLKNKKFGLSPALISNKQDGYLTNYGGRAYTLQECLPGDIRVTPDNVEYFEDATLRSFFGAVARFAKAVRNFVPSKQYSNITLSHYPRHAASLFERAGERLPTSGKRFFVDRKQALLENALRIHEELSAVQYDDLPKQLVHFDLHPGNVHYQNDEVVGVFDFDWVRFDCRIADIAGAIAMSCHSRRGGTLLKYKVSEALAAYRAAYGPSEFDLETENRLVRAAIEASILVQTLWALNWFCEHHAHRNATTILQHWITLSLANDYDSLFLK
jgi:homoserine kinase type II